MKQEDIIRMAREAGLRRFGPLNIDPEIERFANLVEAAEREECAKLLDKDTDLSGLSSDPALQLYTATLLSEFAKAIRARGEK